MKEFKFNWVVKEISGLRVGGRNAIKDEQAYENALRRVYRVSRVLRKHCFADEVPVLRKLWGVEPYELWNSTAVDVRIGDMTMTVHYWEGFDYEYAGQKFHDNRW